MKYSQAFLQGQIARHGPHGGKDMPEDQMMLVYGVLVHIEGVAYREGPLYTTEEEVEEVLEDLQDDAEPGVYYTREEYEVKL